MRITKKWLEGEYACDSEIEWFLCQKETDGLKVVKKLITENKLDWANWLIVRIMKYKQYVSYAVFAAQQVLKNYEDEYPGDKLPRQAIESAIKCIENDSAENKIAAENIWTFSSPSRSAAESSRSAEAAMRIKILDYGIKLLEGKFK